MGTALTAGGLLAIVSGLMNGSFTTPMRFLGRWEWENVWSVFIVGSCIILPTAILAIGQVPLWSVVAAAPGGAVAAAVITGFAWGFGAIMFGQSVSAIGISLANTLVLAISSALGSLVPMLVLAPQKIGESAGQHILIGVAIAVAGIGLCGYAGHLRQAGPQERGEMVGHARPLGVGLLLATGSGLLSAVFNIGFALAHRVAVAGQSLGLTDLASTNVIWWLMLVSGSIANLGFCVYLFVKNKSFDRFRRVPLPRYYALAGLMALLWGGSIFVYGAAASRLGSLGPAIGWPLSLATGLLLANAIGLALGEWKHASPRAHAWMYAGLAVLLAAIVQLSGASG